MENQNISITPSLVIEYMYCPRFIYFMKVLGINQNEDKRYKVEKGREIHEKKALKNNGYLRKKIYVRKKEVEQELASGKYRIHGKIDEILFLDDGFAAPLDYKFAEFKNKIYKTHRYQAVMYAILIEENYNVKVSNAYLVYTRSNNHVEKIDIKEKDKLEIQNIIDEILEIIEKNIFPKATKSKLKCEDCTYNNICIR